MKISRKILAASAALAFMGGTGTEAIVHGPWKWQMPATQGFNTSTASCPTGTRPVEVWRNLR